MPYQTKIATCSYCGRRQTLTLSARAGHELACGACGAPLHEMKWLKAGRGTRASSAARASPRPMAIPRATAGTRTTATPANARSARNAKGLLREVFEEAFDVLDDIFD
jgi:ribosomal protein L34E